MFLWFFCIAASSYPFVLGCCALILVFALKTIEQTGVTQYNLQHVFIITPYSAFFWTTVLES